jgi:hypothetical protein
VAKNTVKRYKRFMLQKRFEEDQSETPARIKQNKATRSEFVKKY